MGEYRSAETAWFLAGYVGVAGFFAMEAVMREHGTASDMRAGVDDQGTTRMIVGAYAAATVLAPLARLAPPRLPSLAAPAGLALQVTGIGLRTWSMRTLRGFYSRTLRAEQGQHVVDTGPYRLVRHPGYTGSLLTWIGFGLTARSVPVAVLVAGLLGHAYQRRIAAEEKLLRRDLPGYAEYSRRTKRLAPFLW